MKKVFFVAGMFLLALFINACSSDEEKQLNEPPLPQPEQTEPQEKPQDNPGVSDSIVVDMLPATRDIELTPEQMAFAQKNNEFAFNLYRAIHEAQEKKQSNITSPLSATFVLGMLNDGARGETATEITRMLGFGESDRQAVNEYCKAFIEQAPIADPSVVLQIADIVAADKTVELVPAYQQHMLDYYSADVASLDFGDLSALDYLNGWCNEKTQGMIPKILDNLNEETRLVLMNAIFFKATWTEKFDENDTREETFTKADGTEVSLPLMYRKAEILYREDDLYSCVRLPFGSGDKYSMFVLLPAEGKTVDDVINGLTNDVWSQSEYANFSRAVVDLKLPRFSTESDIRLNEPVAKLGAPSMFDGNVADFTGMSTNYKRLFVDLMKQKAAIEVTEEGAKMSAVTVARMDSAMDNPALKSATFHANRPFVYLIQERGTRTIFFIGTFQGD